MKDIGRAARNFMQTANCTLGVSSQFDSPNPSVGDHIYRENSTVTCTVTSPVYVGEYQLDCVGWVGTGSVPTTGADISVAFTITENSTITWIWEGGGP